MWMAVSRHMDGLLVMLKQEIFAIVVAFGLPSMDGIARWALAAQCNDDEVGEHQVMLKRLAVSTSSLSMHRWPLLPYFIDFWLLMVPQLREGNRCPPSGLVETAQSETSAG